VAVAESVCAPFDTSSLYFVNMAVSYDQNGFNISHVVAELPTLGYACVYDGRNKEHVQKFGGEPLGKINLKDRMR
jgi:hypothetical protein